MKKLSIRQIEVLCFMYHFYLDNDQLPTMAAIAGSFGWGSANAADQHCRILHAKGALEKNVLGKYKFTRAAREVLIAL